MISAESIDEVILDQKKILSQRSNPDALHVLYLSNGSVQIIPIENILNIAVQNVTKDINKTRRKRRK